MNKTPLHKIITGAVIGLLASLLVACTTFFIWPTLFESFEAKSLDWRYTERLHHLWDERKGATIDDIIIIDIDNRSLEKLGQFSQWPRTYHAQLIDYLTEGGALAVGFDILFMEPDKEPEIDQAFVNATANSGIVYHSMAFSLADQDAFLYPMERAPEEFAAQQFSMALPEEINRRFKTADRMDGKLFELYNAAAGIGFANFSPDNDSVIRTMPMFINFAGRQYFSLSLAMVLGALGAGPDDINITPGKDIRIQPPGSEGEFDLNIPIDDRARAMINYQGTFQTFRYVSYYDVLMQRLPSEMFEGRIVLVGTSAAGLSDIRPVPFQDAFPGVEVHANIIHNILTQDYIHRQSGLFVFINFLLLAIFIAVLANFLKPWQSGLIVLMLAGGYAYMATVWFANDALWIELVRPILTILFAYFFVFIYRYVDEERNKRYIKTMFQHYLTASVVDELLKRPDMLKLGGERREATAFFSDIKSFTTVSESLEPEELVLQLNEYLSAMTKIVLKYEGYLDKYEGDAIMAIFGVPVDQADHAQRACLAALEMQIELDKLRKSWARNGKPEFQARMGVNSGAMIAGNIGGEQRFDYTVIGDSVNLASRLEGANKTYGTSIMISEFTKAQLGEDMQTRELDLLRVKGKTKPVRVFEVLAKRHADLSNAQLILLDEYNKGLQAYRHRRWDEAIAAFERGLIVVPSDGPCTTYVKRCRFYKENPVPANWDGVFEMTTK